MQVSYVGMEGDEADFGYGIEPRPRTGPSVLSLCCSKWPVLQAREWLGGLVPSHSPHAKAKPQPGADASAIRAQDVSSSVGGIGETCVKDLYTKTRPHGRTAGKGFLVQSSTDQLAESHPHLILSAAVLKRPLAKTNHAKSRRHAKRPQPLGSLGDHVAPATYCSNLLTGMVFAERSPSTSACTASTWLLAARRRKSRLHSTSGFQFTGIGTLHALLQPSNCARKPHQT